MNQLRLPIKTYNPLNAQNESAPVAPLTEASNEQEESAMEIVLDQNDSVALEPTDVTPNVQEDIQEDNKVIEKTQVLVSNDPEPEVEEFAVKVEVHKEEEATKKEINQKVKDFGEYDPTLDLSRFRLPGIDLLQQYGDGQITFDKEEIEKNKNNIVDLSLIHI